VHCIAAPVEDGTDTVFRNFGFYYSDAGEIPRRQFTIWNLFSNHENKSYLFVEVFIVTLSNIARLALQHKNNFIICGRRIVPSFLRKAAVPISYRLCSLVV